MLVLRLDVRADVQQSSDESGIRAKRPRRMMQGRLALLGPRLEPMVSLNVRITCVPSTFCPASIATAPWSRSALTVVLPVALMVPPLSVSLFAAIAMPFGAESFTATV